MLRLPERDRGIPEHSVSKEHSFAERQSWLGTIPIPELINCVPVAALSIGAGETVDDTGFRDLRSLPPKLALANSRGTIRVEAYLGCTNGLLRR